MHRPQIAWPWRQPVRKRLCALSLMLLVSACAAPGPSTTEAATGAKAPPPGEIKGQAWVHTEASRRALIQRAQVALPATANGGTTYFGAWRDVPVTAQVAVPVVLFLHGSSGLGLKAIEEWQRWLASLGVASVAPDSFALPDRLTYKSPVDEESYERLHALRASEIEATAAALRTVSWAAAGRWLLAGTSEGAVAVARHAETGFAGRMIFSWSCEDNYFVAAHRTAVAPAIPVLNVMSGTDVFFSPSNAWLGNPAATGHCGAVLAAHCQATVVLIPGAPHTLLNLPAARHVTAGFVRDVLKP